MTENIKHTASFDGRDVWYIANGSVKTVFEYGEKFSYDGIIAVHDVNGIITEYPESDLYIENIPELKVPGQYEISVEVLSEGITFSYKITVKDVNVDVVFANAPTITLGDGSNRIGFDEIDLGHIKTCGEFFVDDIYTRSGKYLQNYGATGNSFGFKVFTKDKIDGAKLIIRMANYAVTMLYPAANIAIFQNYRSINENKKIEIDPNYCLTTRAPTKDGEKGADTSLVWCELALDNISLNKGENTFMFTFIGKEAPFLDCAEIRIDEHNNESQKQITKDNSSNEIISEKAGHGLSAEAVECGAVLLRNKETANGEKALPLHCNEKVNVFGYAGTDKGFIIQGTGSGSGTRRDVITFLDALGKANIPYNKILAKKYSRLELAERKVGGEAGIEDAGFADYYGIAETSCDFLDEETLTQAKNYSETAIVMLGRLFGEGNDYSKYQYLCDGRIDKTRRMLSLSENEEHLIKKVRERFKKVIVILNSANPMECGFAEDYNVDALIWLGYPGSTGATGLANLLVGKVNFSGKLADVYPYDHTTAASFVNSGREGVGEYTDAIRGGNIVFGKYSDYAENIYVGYKWYETADTEGYWSHIENKYGNGYRGVIQYPFGFGLSYTEFEWTVIDSNYKNGDVADKFGMVSITLRIKNIGNASGSDTVQLYYTPPYTKGGIEKSSVNLGAFAKTRVLAPDQYEIIKINMPIEAMKSYDCYDSNNNGFIGYELEEGEYLISLRTDSHTPKKTSDGINSISIHIPQGGYKYELDTVTKNPVCNQFTNFTNGISGATSQITHDRSINRQHSCDGNDEVEKITYLTRADFKATFPNKASLSRTGGETLINDTANNFDFKKDDNALSLPVWNSKETSYTVDELAGVPFEDERWNQITSQMSLTEAAKLVAAGGFGTVPTDSVGIPRTRAFDGPSGFNVGAAGDFTNFPCSTLIASSWDTNIAYRIGKMIGKEGSEFTPKITGWYGPGANIHRSPLGGRNFEYYSEDPVLSGIMCAHHVLGAKSSGVTAYIKHIAVNDCERYRGGVYKWLTEQSLREIYLLPFEYAVKIGKANGLMASVDKVGSGQATSNSALLTAVLRDEWGFRGTVITDYYQGQNINDVDECVRAGCNLMLCPWGDERLFDNLDSPASQNAIFNAAKEVLYTYADTLSFSKNKDK